MGDEQTVRKKKPPRIWHAQHEQILKEWGEASSCYRHMHFKAFQINKVWSMSFTLPVIVISTITGTANFAQKTFPPEIASFIPSVIGAFNLFAAIMTTVAQFLKLAELMESHRVTSIQYGKLARRIRLELTLPISERTQHGDNMVEVCRAEYDRLIEQSPPVPKNVIALFDKTFPNTSNTLYTPELTIIRPIYPFDNEKEETKKKNEVLERRNFVTVVPPSGRSIIRELQSLTNRGIVSSRRVSYHHPATDYEDPPEEPASPVQEVVVEN